MFKTLLLLFLLVVVLRYVNIFYKALYAPEPPRNRPDNRVQQRPGPPSKTPHNSDKGEYIDYEEIK